jgi:hypothetical protein
LYVDVLSNRKIEKTICKEELEMKNLSVLGKRMFRFSLVTALVIGLFWTVYFFIQGSVPSVSSFILGEDIALQFPFGVSRWFDVLIGPVWSCLLLYLYYAYKEHGDTGLWNLNDLWV